MDFGEVLGRAWKITWKHKVLWIFGILAGCSHGGTGANSGYRFGVPGRQGPPSQVPEQDQFWLQFGNWIGAHWWVVTLIILLILVIVIITILLGTLGRIGLIKGTAKADGGAEHLTFVELWDESLPYFWRIFLLSLIVGLAAFVLAVALLLLAIGAAVVTLGIGLICFIPLLCVLVLALWFLGIIVQLAETAIVIENRGIMDGLQRGWDVAKRNVGPVLIMWLILFIIGLAAGLLIAIPVFAIFLPAAIGFAFANGQGTALSWTPLIVAGLCFVVYLPFLLVLNGILTAYLQSAWTLTYLRLTGPKASPEPVEKPETPIIPAPNA